MQGSEILHPVFITGKNKWKVIPKTNLKVTFFWNKATTNDNVQRMNYSLCNSSKTFLKLTQYHEEFKKKTILKLLESEFKASQKSEGQNRSGQLQHKKIHKVMDL